ncbi:MAG: PorV/PorQ family protein [Bacteroidota bacterium]
MRTLLLTIYIAFLSWGAHAQSPPKYSNEFLTIGPGARGHGLSGAMVASVNDLTAAYWNPAGLTGLHGEEETVPFQVSAMHAEWFAGIANYDYLAFAKSLNEEQQSTFAISLIRFGVDQIPNTINLVSPDGTINYDNVTEFSAADYAFMLSYGQRLKNPDWRIGATTKIIRRIVGTFGGAWGFGLDLGLQYQKGNWRLGIMGRDITTTYNAWQFNLSDEEKKVFSQTNNVIPVSSVEVTLPRLVIGGAFAKSFNDQYALLIAADFDVTVDGPRNVLVQNDLISIDPRLGLELSYNNFLFLRTGIGNFQSATDDIDGSTEITSFQPNFGIGLRLGRVTIDYALTDIGDASQVLYSNIVSARIDFRER